MNSKTNSTNSQTKSKSKSSKADDSMLEDFFVDELKDIFWAEKHLVKTLPKMEKSRHYAGIKRCICRAPGNYKTMGWKIDTSDFGKEK